MTCQHVDDLLDVPTDINDNIPRQRRGLGEAVGHVGHHRVPPQDWGVAYYGRHRYQVGGVLHHLPHGAVVGVVVVRTMSQHEIGPEIADRSTDLPTQFERGLQLSIVIRPDFGLGADHGRRRQRFRLAARSYWSPGPLV